MDLAYRTVIGLGLLITIPMMVHHRVRAHTGEPLDRRREGILAAVALRALGAIHIFTLVWYLADPARLAWASLPLPEALRWFGAALGLCAFALLTWALHHLGKNLTDTVVTRKQATLVTTGPYRHIRHPFYTAVGLAMAANALLSANAILAATGALGIVLFAFRSRREEANLIARFGEDYVAYAARTGRFLPRYGSQVAKE